MTTPLASDSEAEASPQTSRRDRQQAEPADPASAPSSDEPRQKVSVASLLLPPVGSVNPDNWKRPVTRSSVPTYRPPEFDAETRAALEAEAAEREAADRKAAEREAAEWEAERQRSLIPAEPRAAVAAEPVLALTPAAPATSKPRRKKPIVKKVKPTEARPTPPPAPVTEPPAGAADEGEAEAEQWTSATPAISNITRQFFAPPEELRPAHVDDQVMETGPDLQLRIYMREILEPWWTGEVGSTTALKRLIALRDSLAEETS